MILTNKAKYATMAAIEMLDFKKDCPVPLSFIASKQNISLSFLEQIFSSLKKAGIVKSVRGANGGYILAKTPQDIKISDVIFAIDEPIKMTRCTGNDGCVKKNARCKTHHLWSGLEQNIFNYLESLSLLDIHNKSLKLQ